MSYGAASDVIVIQLVRRRHVCHDSDGAVFTVGTSKQKEAAVLGTL